jgi:hypothetical protein
MISFGGRMDVTREKRITEAGEFLAGFKEN